MKKFKVHNPVRDVLLAIALILLVKPALHLSARRLRDNEQSAQSTSFAVHELDPQMVQAFEQAKAQLNGAIALTRKQNDSGELKRLEQLSDDLAAIEKKYTRNSPGMMFLGPFASASIVLKELEVEEKLNEIVDQLGTSLQRSTQKTTSTNSHESETLASRLQKNQRLLEASKLA